MIYHTFISQKKSWHNKNNDAKTADKLINYCPACNNCYEIINHNLHYYSDFPRYGKEKKICAKCTRKPK